ncbi:MAG: cation:proton antiporter, partial [Stenotrophobium sp.]
FLVQMAGGAAIGLGSGYVLLWLFRRLRINSAVFPVVALGGALTVFGGAQVLGASGFLAVYLAGIVVGNHEHPAAQPVERFFETLGRLSQITLFLMLGLLVTPHQLPPVILRALAVSAVLIVLARPAGVFACLLPFGWTAPEILFVAWAGLRGAVPIYLTIIPLLTGVTAGATLFKIVFVIVIVSVAVQGWTIALAARLLGLKAD